MKSAFIAAIAAAALAYTVQPIGTYLVPLVRPALHPDNPSLVAACRLAVRVPTDANIEACTRAPI